ncbi:hypothetical protein Ga0074812_115142 [Parafrankia irregularis]|uniref:Uncharacterized protein n=1 Tax=Parafrankia irregularis TaxID=795642 RepID=A0A0S4QRI3_9ACTN|nr:MULTISPECIES: hypothetical protein [Parafrankia]MBE3202751.1 hypothetical protein [Parafrankia sp. CH37]CUU57940.1 hypothetical protein Ga0074812_115142 [Parafrankia irregularis]
MTYTYSEAFRRLAQELGFADDPIKGLVHLRHPGELANWTLPVVEGVMIGGAGLGLLRALERWRRDADPNLLAVWAGSVAYLMAIEPPLYFPDAFHMPEYLRDVFAHNVFSVQFLHEHLPLYIIALYPAVASLAYEIVDSFGVFSDNVLLGAVCVGFVHQIFYEIFDHIGPQLKWWIWNTDAPTNSPSLGSVPMTSVFQFATLGPAALVLLAHLIVGRKVDRGETISGRSLAGRSLAIGALVPAAVALVSTPIGKLGERFSPRAALGGSSALPWVVAVPTLAAAWRRSRATTVSADAATTGAEGSSWFGVTYGSAYLAAFGVLWGKALPAFRAAKGGVTSEGTRIGNLPYTIACGAAAAAALAGVATAGRQPARARRGLLRAGLRAARTGSWGAVRR